MKFSECEIEWLKSLPDPDGILKNIQTRSRNCLLNHQNLNNNKEEWKLTDIKRLENFIRLPLSARDENGYEEKYPVLKQKQNNILQLVINPINNQINESSLPEGIRKLTDEQLKLHLGKTINNFKFKDQWPILINESSTKQVIGLELKGEELPILEIIFPASPNFLNSTRLILIVEENTNFELIQVMIGKNNSAQSNLIEIIAGEKSNIKHGLIALGGGEGNLLTHLAIEQEISSEYSLTSLQEGWNFSRLEPNVIQKNGCAKTTLKGLQITTDKQQISTHSFVQFNGPNGRLEQINKSAASGNSHSIFNGAITVPQIAQKTEASQLSRNLLLSQRARIDTKPELEIIADDVRCTHGATVSQLQEEELFYLRSRGISLKAANSILLEGYFKEILNSLPLSSGRWFFLKDILSTNK